MYSKLLVFLIVSQCQSHVVPFHDSTEKFVDETHSRAILDHEGNVIPYNKIHKYDIKSTKVENELTETIVNDSDIQDHHADLHGIHVATWRWEELGVFFTFTTFIVITGLAKVAFHHAHWLSDHVPESCLMIVVGVTVGGIMFSCGVHIPENTHDSVIQHAFSMPTFTPRLFFLILLPPVILEAAYSLYERSFGDNIGTIALYAVVGTLINTFSIGPIIYGLDKIGLVGSMQLTEDKNYSLSMIDILVFSSLISGVDPVAVLAIFQEVGVNKDLYYLVFGESLFNDAVTVVLYSTMVTFSIMPYIPNGQYALAVLAFFTVSLGGMLVGVIFGLISSLLTKTTTDCRVVEPLAVLGIAYLSYITAELFHFSGIISIIFCGLVQAHYALKNISQKSYTTVKYFTRMLSSTSDAIIFLFLGMVLVSDRHIWHTGFVLWVLFLCLVCRFVSVGSLTAIANKFRVRKINLQEQFLMGYAGLRGAIAFSLAEMLDESVIKPKQVFVTTTLVVILFTVFIQGSTIKPLVGLLHIKLSKDGSKSLNQELHDNVMSNTMAGIEEITGVRGDFYLRRKFEQIDNEYLKKAFLHEDVEHNFTKLYGKLILAEHIAHLYGPVTLVEDNKTDVLHNGVIRPQPKPPRLPKRFSRRMHSFHGVQLRNPAAAASVLTPPGSPAVTDPSLGLLRKAINSAPYSKYHQRYNRNLIDDDYQELGDQLARRRMTFKRITHAASIARRSTMSDLPVSPRLTRQVSLQRTKIHSQLERACPEEMEGIDAILERRDERLQRQNSSVSETSDLPAAVSSRNDSTEQYLPNQGLEEIRESEDEVFLPNHSKPVNESAL